MTDEFQISNGPARSSVVLLRCAGTLDTKSASQLLHRCSAVRNAGHSLILNLSGVTFIASSGIGALLALTEQFRDSDIPLRFVALSQAVRGVIQLLNLDQFLTIYDTEDEALTELEARDAA